ncbi:MAG TPA: DUF4160 domain-containing protein [Pyrinomonadaceae bacterium]|nr:DUF4160 domain-containing protein [Pyrinomonadaceae bacterium]
MPVISMFYGIVVMMYYFDDRRHHLPHIHVECGDEEAVVSIPDGSDRRFNQDRQVEIGASLGRDSSG